MPTSAEPGTPLDDGSVIDILVLYTPAARHLWANEAGGIEDRITTMVTLTNSAYRASKAVQRIAAVAVHEVNYVEGATLGIDLDRLTDPKDGEIDQIHALRDQYGADLVHLLVGRPRQRVCGEAWSPVPLSQQSAWSGFGVTASTCPPLTFAHELGHNMGLWHDRWTVVNLDKHDPKHALHPWAFGYVNQRAFDGNAGAPIGSLWTTIMAYESQCTDTFPWVTCRWLPVFSNPDVRPVSGATNWCDDCVGPLGTEGTQVISDVVGPANAVRTLNETRHVIVNYRHQPTLAGRN